MKKKITKKEKEWGFLFNLIRLYNFLFVPLFYINHLNNLKL